MQLNDLRKIKNWSVAIRPVSPGDIFRLLHGLRVKFKGEHVAIICDTNTLSLTEGLCCDVKQSTSTPFDGGSIRIDENLHWVCINQLQNPESKGEYRANQIVDAWKSIFPNDKLCFEQKMVWTCFSNHRTKDHESLLEDQHKVELRRVDSGMHNPDFFKTVFNLPQNKRTPCSEKLKLIVVLREEGIHEWRHSPPYHTDVNWLSNLDVDVSYGGLEYNKNYPNKYSKCCIPFHKMTFRESIDKAMDFDIAIGVNSSALDVFAAAGRMVVREAVFQGLYPQQWLGGWGFNSFLGIGPNIELKISENDYGNENWHNPQRMRSAIEVAIAFAKEQQYPINTGHALFQGFDESPDEPQVIKKWLDSLQL